jgi:hypothetical protein
MISPGEGTQKCSGGAAPFAGAAVSAFLLLLNEVQQMVDGRDQFVVAAKDFASMIQPHFGTIDQAMSFVQRLDGLERENGGVSRRRRSRSGAGRVAFDQHVRRHVVQNAAHAADETVAADRREVMDADVARQGAW